MTTLTEYQLALTGLELKEQGIARVSRYSWVDEARRVAWVRCYRSGNCTSDDVHYVMPPPPHDNCYGAIFKDKRFVATDRTVPTTRPQGHCRRVVVWRLANE